MAKNIPTKDLLNYENLMNTLNVAISAAKAYQSTTTSEADPQAYRNALNSVTAALTSMAYEHGKSGNAKVRSALEQVRSSTIDVKVAEERRANNE